MVAPLIPRAARGGAERPAPPRLERRDAVFALGAGIVALALYLHTLAPTITLANGAGDSGELASTAYTLGIAHPTGYPLYTLLGFAVTHLGGGAEPAFDLNVFSALLGALAMGLLALLALRVARRSVPRAPWSLAALAAGLAVAACGLSADLWTEAVVTETRTLALALDAAVLCLLIVPARPQRRWCLSAAFLYGLALGDHLLSLYLAPAVILLAAAYARASARRWLALLACFLAGLCCYLYLPLRAAAHPAANWGDPQTLGRFLWVVSGQEFRYQMFGLAPAELLARLGTSLRTVWLHLNGVTLLAAVLGSVIVLRRQSRLGVALLLTVGVAIVATSNYQAGAAPAYLLLAELCLAILAATGWLAAGRLVLDALVRLGYNRRAALALSGAVAVVLGGGAELPAAVSAGQAVAAAHATAERDYGVAVLRGLPRGAVIFAADDAALMPLWYAQRGLRVRPDVTIVATGLLTFAWYYQQVRALPAFDRRALPDSNRSIDDGANFTLSQQRTTLLAQALRPGHALFAALPDPALNDLCRQLPYGQVYQCVP